MSYAIDSATVELANLRSSEQPAQAKAIYARVPGVQPLTAIQPEPAGAGTVEVRGTYHAPGATYAESYAALVAKLDEWRGLQHDGEAHSITLHGVTYPACQLDDLQIGRRRRFSRTLSDGSPESGAAVDVRFTWRRLTGTTA